MCAMCGGQSIGDFVADVVDDIRCVGWAVIAVEDERGRHVHTYTAGLTRYHGHPELIVSGADFATAHHVLDTLAGAVRDGRPIGAGQVLGPEEVGRECMLVRVDDPSRLVLAQALYETGLGPVPALQVVWSDEAGRWPWELCEHHRDGQELLGQPWPPAGGRAVRG